MVHSSESPVVMAAVTVLRQVAIVVLRTLAEQNTRASVQKTPMHCTPCHLPLTIRQPTRCRQRHLGGGATSRLVFGHHCYRSEQDQHTLWTVQPTLEASMFAPT
jgi:hypothetical protein